MRLKTNFTIPILSVAMLVACKHDKGPLPTAAVAGECDTIVYYTENIVPIMKLKCATPGCHEPGVSYGDFTTHVGIKGKIENTSFKNRVFTLADMPPSGNPTLTEVEKKQLKCWIEQGYPENSKDPNGANTCLTTISYSVNIVPILTANCSSIGACHGSGSSNGDYTTHTALKSAADNGTLNNRVVVVRDMPGTINLSEEAIGKIDCWIKQGALNN
jgi:hypothetical protein